MSALSGKQTLAPTIIAVHFPYDYGVASLAKQAHKIISQAGMLGLMRLSRRARTLEDACDAGVGIAEALCACCEAAGDIERYAIAAATAAGSSYKQASR